MPQPIVSAEQDGANIVVSFEHPIGAVAANPTGYPIGGGTGYPTISPSDPDIIATCTNLAQFFAALDIAGPGDIIFIPGTATITAPNTEEILIPGGVTIASDRGNGGSLGGKITWGASPPAVDGAYMFYSINHNVRFTGLRIEGPTTGTDAEYHYIGLKFSYLSGWQVDNCEISGFGNTAIMVTGRASGVTDMQTGGWIHHNYIHHNQLDGLGYGVNIGTGGLALVEANLFDYNRHDITSNGQPGSSYEARFNVFGPNRLSTSPHQCDMHGKWDADDEIVYAGDIILIHHNTFQPVSPGDAYPISIRGRPATGAWVYHNWFYWTSTAPVLHNNPYGLESRGNLTVEENWIGSSSPSFSLFGPIHETLYDDPGVYT